MAEVILCPFLNFILSFTFKTAEDKFSKNSIGNFSNPFSFASSLPTDTFSASKGFIFGLGLLAILFKPSLVILYVSGVNSSNILFKKSVSSPSLTPFKNALDFLLASSAIFLVATSDAVNNSSALIAFIV